MSKPFLSAAWLNLVMANYAVDPVILQPYLPSHTELDTFNDIHYISLVGFLFDQVKIQGMSIPFHTRFEEVNLRFYVRHKTAGKWNRGVVFIKEIVPLYAVSFIANRLYGEKYATHYMKHTWKETADGLEVSYSWKVKKIWNYIRCTAEKEPEDIAVGSAEEFITEHYWGYTALNQKQSGLYEVSHPKWRIHKVKDYDIVCNAPYLYGKDFNGVFQAQPHTVFLAEGSPVQIMPGRKIISAS